MCCVRCDKRSDKDYNFYYDPDNKKIFSIMCSKECHDEHSTTVQCCMCPKRTPVPHTHVAGKDPVTGEVNHVICSQACVEKFGDEKDGIHRVFLCSRCDAKSDRKCNLLITSNQVMRTNIIFVHCSKKCLEVTRDEEDGENLSYTPKYESGRCCAKCSTISEKDKFNVCARCKEVHYCSRKCQVAHWPAHKANCKESHKKKVSGSEDEKRDTNAKDNEESRVIEEVD